MESGGLNSKKKGAYSKQAPFYEVKFIDYFVKHSKAY